MNIGQILSIVAGSLFILGVLIYLGFVSIASLNNIKIGGLSTGVSFMLIGLIMFIIVSTLIITNTGNLMEQFNDEEETLKN